MKKQQWEEFGKPVVVLVAICIVTSLLLALTNSVTKPVIDANEEKVAQAAYLEVLPEADGFDDLADYHTADVLAVMQARNGTGYVLKAQGQGYGGKVPCVVAFNSAGTIVGVKFLENSETKGFGSRLYEQPDWAEQFTGRSADNFTLGDIDALSGATISSKAAVQALNSAIDVYNEVVKGGA